MVPFFGCQVSYGTLSVDSGGPFSQVEHPFCSYRLCFGVSLHSSLDNQEQGRQSGSWHVPARGQVELYWPSYKAQVTARGNKGSKSLAPL